LGFIGEEAGLTWQDTPQVLSNTLNWDDANNYCQSLFLDGLGDWRLPDYTTLRDYSNIAIFNNPLNRYWSSDQAGADRAWFHDFNVDDGATSDRSSLFGVRCVRGFDELEAPQ